MSINLYGQQPIAGNGGYSSAANQGQFYPTGPTGQYAQQSPLQGLNPHGTPRQVELLPNVTGLSYIQAAIPTSKEAGMMYDSHLATIFNQPWKLLVNQAAQRNGGMGNAQDGFLAWSKIGFVRLNNPNLTAEQNQQIAELSLTMGIQIENSPARADKAGPETAEWVNSFITKAQSALTQFTQNPTSGVEFKDGKHHYALQLDPQNGVVGSMYYKEHGGIRGFFQKAMKWISPVTDLISTAGSFIPGAGTVVAAGAQAVKGIVESISNGKLKIGGLLSSIASFIPGTSTLGRFAQSALRLGGEYLDAGRLKAQSWASAINYAFSDYIPTRLGQALSMGADIIDGKKGAWESAFDAAKDWFFGPSEKDTSAQMFPTESSSLKLPEKLFGEGGLFDLSSPEYARIGR